MKIKKGIIFFFFSLLCLVNFSMGANKYTEDFSTTSGDVTDWTLKTGDTQYTFTYNSGMGRISSGTPLSLTYGYFEYTGSGASSWGDYDYTFKYKGYSTNAPSLYFGVRMNNGSGYTFKKVLGSSTVTATQSWGSVNTNNSFSVSNDTVFIVKIRNTDASTHVEIWYNGTKYFDADNPSGTKYNTGSIYIGERDGALYTTYTWNVDDISVDDPPTNTPTPTPTNTPTPTPTITPTPTQTPTPPIVSTKTNILLRE